MEGLEIKIAGVTGLIVLLIIKRIISSKKDLQWLNKSLTILLFLVVIGFLTYEFISREFYEGLIAVGMGAAAFGKVLYDLR